MYTLRGIRKFDSVQLEYTQNYERIEKFFLIGKPTFFDFGFEFRACK